VTGNENDAEIRAALIAAARAQIGRDDSSHFNIRGLCEEAGIAKSEFRRFFPGKEALIAAVLEDDVAQLHQIADAVAEPRASLAVANGAPVSAPPTDAWLERRLRVFERALAGLETRQEKTEQLLNRSVALLEEKIAKPAPHPVFHAGMAPVAAPAPEPPTSAPQPLHKTPSAEPRPPATLTPLPALELDTPPPVSPKEMEDLLANARRVAREAVVEVPEAKPKRLPGWMANWMTWVAVSCLVLMALTAVILGTIAGASARRDGVSHRQLARPTLAQLTALANKGDARSQTALAFLYIDDKRDPASALRWGLAAAKQGVPMAQYLVATLYQDGANADPRQAFAWFEAAALRGNVKAMHDLAIAYAEGQGTAHDPARAAAWFNRAAGQGYVDSQFDLAVLYERGDGVRQNPQTALKWYLIAAGAGDAQAKIRAGQLASEMSSSDVARAKNAAENFTPSERDQAANTL
jgi:AcrR family transcriptional regulator